MPYPPEFSAFVVDPTRGNSTSSYWFNFTSSRDNFNRDLTNPSTFLNLRSMRQFYTAYETEDLSMM